MSDFSDRVHAAFHEIAGREAEENNGVAFTLVSNDKDVKNSPLSDDFMTFDAAWNQKYFSILRRQYRHQAGQEIPDNYGEVHERLKGLLVDQLVPFYKQCIAAGIQMGQEEAALVKRAKRLGRVSELYKKDEFISECALMAMSWDDEYELAEHLGRYLEGSAVHLATNAGLPAAKQRETIARAWDVWGVSGRSLLALSYTVGEIIGRQDKENDIIAHAQREIDDHGDT